ncbi:hypothetical protein B0T19DRAFT_160508 [Cercophora scortea]|uniref:Uncharacterized protein n=1 Tax=Cercophora scortea TaxID=314031 RepID=A0AAE0MCF1_9PEZI|nr:hypothetical protein B0T19DRAFT_160508 [Cercophora scortea]
MIYTNAYYLSHQLTSMIRLCISHNSFPISCMQVLRPHAMWETQQIIPLDLQPASHPHRHTYPLHHLNIYTQPSRKARLIRDPFLFPRLEPPQYPTNPRVCLFCATHLLLASLPFHTSTFPAQQASQEPPFRRMASSALGLALTRQELCSHPAFCRSRGSSQFTSFQLGCAAARSQGHGFCVDFGKILIYQGAKIEYESCSGG